MKKKFFAIVVIYLAIIVLLYFRLFGDKEDNTGNSDNNTNKTEEFVLTNTMKAKVENYCYFLDEFKSEKDFDKEFIENFISNQYLYFGNKNEVTEVTFADGTTHSMGVTNKEEIDSLFELIFGRKMPEVDFDKTDTFSAVFCENDKYYIETREAGDFFYQYDSGSIKNKQGIINVLKVEEETQTKIEVTVEKSSNINGFIIKKVSIK